MTSCSVLAVSGTVARALSPLGSLFDLESLRRPDLVGARSALLAGLAVLALLAVSPAVAGSAPTVSGSTGATPGEGRRLQIAEGGDAGNGVLEAFPGSTNSETSETPEAPLATPLAIAPGEVLGAQRTLVTFVNFAHDRTVNYAPVDAYDVVYDPNEPGSAAAFVAEVSYGRAWLTQSTQFVTGQFEASYDDSACLVRTADGTQQLVDELDNALDFSTVDRWIVVIPSNSSCGFVGLSTLGKWDFDTEQGPQTFSRILLNGSSALNGPLVAHELGHSFAGLQHSLDWECGTEVVGPACTATGTDRYDVMAASADGGHFTPSGKQALEWFDTQIEDVDGAGGTYLLEPYETTGAGLKALRIRADGPYDDFRVLDDYWVSYRKPLGFDSGFAELATDGAMLHLGTEYFPEHSTDATGPSLLLDAKPNGGSQVPDSQDVLLEAGQSFVDTDRGITIETLGIVGSALEVQVTRTKYCGNGVLDDSIGEQCDGSDLGPATCASLGRSGGTLACGSTCEFDTSGCGAELCAPGDVYDEPAGLCTATFLGAGPIDMGLVRNSSTFDLARTTTVATLLTLGGGFLGTNQNFDQTGRSIIWRLNIPFDTQGLPDGATIDSATLRMKYDVFGDPYSNTHPESADDLVLVQTSDPAPTVREESDYGVFLPVDAPPEGAPRIDVSDTYVTNGDVEFPLNATGLSWIDDQGYTLLGMRTGWDVDDVEVAPGEELDFNVNFVPPNSPISGPRLEVVYQPAPEPGAAAALATGIGLLIGLGRRRRAAQGSSRARRCDAPGRV